MGKAFSQVTSQQDEGKSILSANPALSSKPANYLSTGNSKPPCSGVLYARAAGAGFVICPTCQGNGEIPREQEKQLVALIPYGDRRLKPPHTPGRVVWASGQRASCLCSPPGRRATLTVSFPCRPLQNILNISNSNFYPITVTRLTAEVLHQTSVVGQVTSSLRLHIRPLASEQMPYKVASSILDENTYKICAQLKVKVHHILLHIQGTLTCSYLSHPQQLPFESFEYVDCKENMSMPHLEIPRPA
ncbi:transmembrane protein 106A isoform X2 [Cricetulus griseus]|uniref:Transmembrane protein 106A isoform X2 n=1 Tax=Cricetulus griseus TaxID=10029 RepID=A0A9J7H3K3_CRIGR|nr:transmembrane protein 106A isoform X2 [Cricetulus griseus]XP_035313147.1 transmembrane protein 106A isoform X2 [Cricetulus griseus]